ncbi:MAG TPA: YtxH domain-containing protein [Bryobacteraceae bacterium]|jgi:gas vesicle protein|nr:YtxH domain-containing protein [Bryobacteraceae bacterium]
MEDDNKFSYFFLGLGLGVAVGLLFAPKAGAETRDFIKTKAGEGADYVKRRSSELRDTAGDLMDRGKQLISKQRDQLSSAVEAGKQAYREAVSGAAERNVTNEGM